jgi:hypothetical protein
MELLDLGIQLLPLVLRLGLDLLQHLHLTSQLLVVCLQALLVLFQVCFELGEGRENNLLVILQHTVESTVFFVPAESCLCSDMVTLQSASVE